MTYSDQLSMNFPGSALMTWSSIIAAVSLRDCVATRHLPWAGCTMIGAPYSIVVLSLLLVLPSATVGVTRNSFNIRVYDFRATSLPCP